MAKYQSHSKANTKEKVIIQSNPKCAFVTRRQFNNQINRKNYGDYLCCYKLTSYVLIKTRTGSEKSTKDKLP